MTCETLLTVFETSVCSQLLRSSFWGHSSVHFSVPLAVRYGHGPCFGQWNRSRSDMPLFGVEVLRTSKCLATVPSHVLRIVDTPIVEHMSSFSQGPRVSECMESLPICTGHICTGHIRDICSLSWSQLCCVRNSGILGSFDAWVIYIH